MICVLHISLNDLILPARKKTAVTVKGYVSLYNISLRQISHKDKNL